MPAARQHYEPIKPLGAAGSSNLAAQHEHDDMLDIEDVLGKRHIRTEWGKTIILTEDRTLAALEVMSRFAVHPKWDQLSAANDVAVRHQQQGQSVGAPRGSTRATTGSRAWKRSSAKKSTWDPAP